MTESKDQIGRTLYAAERLTVYRGIFDCPVMKSFPDLLALALKREPAAVRKYYSFVGKLLEVQGGFTFPGTDIFKSHLLETMLSVENAISLACEKSETGALNSLLTEALLRDLRLLQAIYEFDLRHIISLMDSSGHNDGLNLTPGRPARGTDGETPYPGYYFRRKTALKELLSSSADWGDNVEELISFYRETGSGQFGRYWAFKWDGSCAATPLAGVGNPDPIRMEDLVGYEDQQEEVIRNTRQFVKGHLANNILLYGDRGTGKSSTIKGLVHIFGSAGLRVVEVSRHDLLSLHKIIRLIRSRPQKFIIFIDDLSFEESETEYKDLKAILEGSIEKPPANVLIYATSNRKNLVREFFRDREPDEAGSQETYQEKLSLADRFGIKLVYLTPDKWEFLKMVEDIARRSGLTMEKAKLDKLAVEWVMWHNSRSGRTARQFVNDLKGRLDLDARP